MNKKIFGFIKQAAAVSAAIGILGASLIMPVTIVSADVDQPEIPVPAIDDVHCASYCVYDKTSDEVILSSDPDKRIYPASQTKIMTCMLALDYLDTDAYLVVSKNAMDNITSDSSVMGVRTGEKLEVSELLYGLMLPSGNDAANVLAEGVVDALLRDYPKGGGKTGPDGVDASFLDPFITYGSSGEGTDSTTASGEAAETDETSATTAPVTNIRKLGAFAELMNLRAKNIGCTGTHFVNASGLHSDEHYTTASDLTKIMAAASERADFKTLISSPSHVFKATNLHKDDAWSYVKSTDYLLFDPWMAAKTANGEKSHLVCIVGGKTGTTSKAGKGVTLYTVNENGHEVMVSMCGVPGEYYFYTTMYLASIAAYGNLECWKKEPVPRILGTTGDYRTVNAPADEQPQYDSFRYPGDELVNYIEDKEEPEATPTATPTPVPLEKEPETEHPLVLFVKQNKLISGIAAGLVFAIIICNIILLVRVIKLKNAGTRRRRVRKSPDNYVK
ncbi:MAG: D-alanyl-D-alanine carboxypeptidase [Clostridiales bacterium]|nr:D-alanyl-D-alanine carboxypeptidase [Clostridiales bacterium]